MLLLARSVSVSVSNIFKLDEKGVKEYTVDRYYEMFFSLSNSNDIFMDHSLFLYNLQPTTVILLILKY